MFHPFVESIEQLSAADKGVGATRSFDLYSKSCQVEEIVEWNKGESYIVESKDAPLIKELLGRMSVVPICAQTSKVTLNMFYSMKWGFVGEIINLLMLRIGIRYTLQRVLKSLEHLMATGERVRKEESQIENHLKAQLNTPVMHG